LRNLRCKVDENTSEGDQSQVPGDEEDIKDTILSRGERRTEQRSGEETYPGIKRGEVGRHVPEIRGLWTNILLEL
jgi:hypothetical protein